MQYNIHPIFVHFPIAFLLLYSILVIIPFEKIFSKLNLQITKSTLLILGTVSLFVSAATGDQAQHLLRIRNEVMEMHELFAQLTIFSYSLLLVGELLKLSADFINRHLKIEFFKKIIFFIKNILTNKFLVIIIAIFGLIAISLTGMFGGILVHGTTADPLAPIILDLFNITL
ncbi:hypothetical protein H6775_02605 [Candidatus Nomurabacteria bacterium]|nr:hypothetical protein [Candidatus Nomurabacteria bacterium]